MKPYRTSIEIMHDRPAKTLDDLVRHVGKYPEDAFVFVKEALAYAVEKVHGPETEAHRELYRFLAEESLDWNGLVSRYEQGNLPDAIIQAVEDSGGCEKLNRHVSGRDLCWGLREYALNRWGLLARSVLEQWGVRSTADFGKIVFGFIDLELMQKQPQDTLDDFDDVYDFEEAFDETFRSGLCADDEEVG